MSLQNGVRNARVLAEGLPKHAVVAGMVPFNVVRPAPSHFHRATEGILMFGPCPPLASACVAAGLAAQQRDDMPEVLWGKLLINLGNAVNALCGLPLVEQLSQRAYRRCLAACQREALDLLAAAGERAAKLTPVPPAWMPRLLGLPDAIFRPLARRMVAVDANARSSMCADDLEHGRATEIDYLQGEIVALAEAARPRGLPRPSHRRARALHAPRRTGRRDWRRCDRAARAGQPRRHECCDLLVQFAAPRWRRRSSAPPSPPAVAGLPLPVPCRLDRRAAEPERSCSSRLTPAKDAALRHRRPGLIRLAMAGRQPGCSRR